MTCVDEKVKQDRYSHYKALINSYYQDLDIIHDLEDKIISGSASKLETNMYYTQVDKFNDECTGEFRLYPEVSRNGNEVIKRKKVRDGIYEPILDYVIKAASKIHALKKLQTIMEVDDPTLCCTEEEYCRYLNDRESLQEIVSAYQKRLNEVNQVIKDYEVMHEGE